MTVQNSMQSNNRASEVTIKIQGIAKVYNNPTGHPQQLYSKSPWQIPSHAKPAGRPRQLGDTTNVVVAFVRIVQPCSARLVCVVVGRSRQAQQLACKKPPT